MQVDAVFFAVAVPAVLYAGISKGGFANGAAFAATPFLALAMPPGAAIGVMLPLLMLMDLGAVRAYWGRWTKAVSLRLILGAIPGVALGALVWRVAPADLFRVLIGIVAVGFVIFQLARARGWLVLGKGRQRPIAGYFWGSVAGLTSFVSNAGGPPAAVYMLSLKMDKTTYQATSVLAFWGINLLKVPAFLGLGIFTRQTLLADVFLAPVALVGVWIGVKLHRSISDRVYFGLAYTFLTLAGSKLIWDGLT